MKTFNISWSKRNKVCFHFEFDLPPSEFKIRLTDCHSGQEAKKVLEEETMQQVTDLVEHMTKLILFDSLLSISSLLYESHQGSRTT